MNSDKKLTKIRITFLSVLSFIIMFSYAISRPAAESLFLEAHTSKSLPYVWLLGIAGMFLVVSIYNRFVTKVDLLKLIGIVLLVNCVLLTILILASSAKLPGSFYALYIWKDIYIIILVEMFYSYTNSVFPIKIARWAYGFFGVIASMAGIIGNLLVGKLAKDFGTLNSLWLVIPLFIGSWIISIPFLRMAGIGRPLESKKATSFHGAIKSIKDSPYLFLVLLLIILIQVASTLIDFQFNTIVEKAFTDVDIRTAVIGRVYAAVSTGTVVLNLATGPILRIIGIPITIILIPLILGSGLAIFTFIPRFLTMAIVKVSNKCLDYTIFRITKETLYIPLTYEEKTLGKSIVDMFIHRTSKGMASLLLLLLIAIKASTMTIWLALFVIILWAALAVLIGKRFRKKVTREMEMHSGEITVS